MRDLKDYFSKQDEISGLRDEIISLNKTIEHERRLKHKHMILSSEVCLLRAEVVRLDKKVKSENMMKRKYKIAADILKPKDTRADKTKELLILKKAGLKISCREIAAKCFVSLSLVYNLSSKINKKGNVSVDIWKVNPHTLQLNETT